MLVSAMLNSNRTNSNRGNKISLQSVDNFLSNVVHRQTNKQTDRQTNTTKNITSFAKEVISVVKQLRVLDF